MKITVSFERIAMRHELFLQRHPRLRVDGGERLVHQHHFGRVGERARDGDALLHAARQLVRILVLDVVQVGDCQDSGAPSHSARRARMPRSLRPSAALSSTFIHGSSAYSWNTTPRSALGPSTARAVHRRCVPAGRAAGILRSPTSSVDLPQPARAEHAQELVGRDVEVESLDGAVARRRSPDSRSRATRSRDGDLGRRAARIGVRPASSQPERAALGACEMVLQRRAAARPGRARFNAAITARCSSIASGR